VPPWDLAKQSIIWQRWALTAQNAENEAQGIQMKRYFD
jgi:hypothetical protein